MSNFKIYFKFITCSEPKFLHIQGRDFQIKIEIKVEKSKSNYLNNNDNNNNNNNNNNDNKKTIKFKDFVKQNKIIEFS